MSTVTVDAKLFAQQTAKAKIFAGTSNNYNQHDKHHLQVTLEADKITLTASSRDSINMTHVVADYTVPAVRSTTAIPLAIVADAKELADTAKLLQLAGQVTLRASHNYLTVEQTPIQTRGEQLAGVQTLRGRSQQETEPLTVLDPKHVATLKKHVAGCAATPKYDGRISVIHLKDGAAEATDGVGAVRAQLSSFTGETFISAVAFRHIKVKDTLTISASPNVSVIDAGTVKVYTKLNKHTNPFNALDGLFNPPADTSIHIQIEQLTSLLKPIKKRYGTLAEITLVQRGSNLHLVHIAHHGETSDAEIVGSISGVGGQGDISSVWGISVLLKFLGNYKGAARIETPKALGQPAKIVINNNELILMRKSNCETAVELAESKVDNDQ